MIKFALDFVCMFFGLLVAIPNRKYKVAALFRNGKLICIVKQERRIKLMDTKYKADWFASK